MSNYSFNVVHLKYEGNFALCLLMIIIMTFIYIAHFKIKLAAHKGFRGVSINTMIKQS